MVFHDLGLQVLERSNPMALGCATNPMRPVPPLPSPRLQDQDDNRGVCKKNVNSDWHAKPVVLAILVTRAQRWVHRCLLLLNSFVGFTADRHVAIVDFVQCDGGWRIDIPPKSEPAAA